jgi:hypothetical protein
MRAEVQAEVRTEMARLTAASRQAAPVQNRADAAASDIWAYVAERGSSEADTKAFFNGPDKDEVDAFFNEPDKDEEDKAFLDNLDDDEDAHAVSDEQRALLVSFESARRHAMAQQLMAAKWHAASNARAVAQRITRYSARRGNQAQIDHQRGFLAMVEAQQRRKAKAATGKASAIDPREFGQTCLLGGRQRVRPAPPAGQSSSPLPGRGSQASRRRRTIEPTSVVVVVLDYQ